MLIYKCDHCGEVIMNVYKASVKYKVAEPECEEIESKIFYGDLCKECFNALENFFCASTDQIKAVKQKEK